LYLEIFAAVLEAAQRMAEKGIIHFDLKCDNVLLEPLPGVSEERFWAPSENDVSAVGFATEKASAVDFEAGPSSTAHVSAGQTREDRVEAATASTDQKSATDRNECPSKTSTIELVAASQTVCTRSQAPVSKPQSLATRSASLSIKDMLSNKFKKSPVTNQVKGQVDNQVISQVKSQVRDGVKSRVALPFRVVLADFGQSKICRQSDVSGGITVRNRGTDFVKSPEMLTVFNAARACNAGGLKKVRVSGFSVLLWRPILITSCRSVSGFSKFGGDGDMLSMRQL
jgi:serine/threonine protein kinase